MFEVYGDEKMNQSKYSSKIINENIGFVRDCSTASKAGGKGGINVDILFQRYGIGYAIRKSMWKSKNVSSKNLLS